MSGLSKQYTVINNGRVFHSDEWKARENGAGSPLVMNEVRHRGEALNPIRPGTVLERQETVLA